MLNIIQKQAGRSLENIPGLPLDFLCSTFIYKFYYNAAETS